MSSRWPTKPCPICKPLDAKATVDCLNCQGKRVVVDKPYGEPDDVEGECNAHLHIGDNFGDNHATIRCQFGPDHNGAHRETYKRLGLDVSVTWFGDDRLRHQKLIEAAHLQSRETENPENQS